MSIDSKEALAMTRDMTPKAAAIRVLAARLAIGMGQEQLAQDMGEGMTKQKMANAERGANYPPQSLLKYLHRQHGIDFNFMMHGDFSHLHPDLQARLFDALARAHSVWDQKRGSDQRQDKRPPSQP